MLPVGRSKLGDFVNSGTDGYFDHFFEEMIPWREFSPEEYAARHWIEFGAFSVTETNKFRNQDMEAWAKRFEEIFHDPQLIEQCRERFLTPEERQAQDETLRKIEKNGF
jgi:hypothetical protein